MVMQYLVKLCRSMMKMCVVITCLFTLSHPVLAGEIKVYLNQTHAEQIIGIDEAKAYGYTINFIFLDRIDELQDQISDRVTQKYQSATDAVIAEVGLEALMKMGDTERTEFFMKQFAQMKIEPITPNTILPSEIDDVKHAVSDTSKAEEDGVTSEMLPAIIIKGRLFERQFDLLPPVKESQL